MKRRPEEWEKIRAKGVFTYFSLILVGLIPVIISSVIGEFLQYGFKYIFTKDFYFRSVGITIIVIISGAIIGFIKWTKYERDRKKSVNNRSAKRY